MTTAHCSEEELQHFANAPHECSSETAEHVAACKVCEKQVTFYRFIVAEMLNQQPATFDFDLSSSVLQQLPAPRQSKAIRRIPIVLPAIFVFVVMYIFRNNIGRLLTGVSPALLMVIVFVCTMISVFKVMNVYRVYDRKIKQLDFIN